MNSNELDADALDFAESVCTPKQMEVLRLRAEGMGLRATARQLLITPSSAKDRLEGALLHLRKAIIEREVEEHEGEHAAVHE